MKLHGRNEEGKAPVTKTEEHKLSIRFLIDQIRPLEFTVHTRLTGHRLVLRPQNQS